MIDSTPLSNAPISEAVFDVQIIQLPDDMLGQLSVLGESIKDRFPVRQERQNFVMQVVAQGSQNTSFNQSGSILGYVYANPESGKVVQFRLDGFTFSKLRPYARWSEFYPEAVELWNTYAHSIDSTVIKRVALRYINQIEIPMSSPDFSEYLKTYPEIAKGTPQGLRQFSMMFVAPDDLGTESVGTVQLIMPPPTDPTKSTRTIIFDIDVWKQFDGLLANDSTVFEATFTSLRDFKNRIFFSSLTEKCIGMFK